MNISGLNSSIKRQRLSEWIKIHTPTVRCLQETHLRFKYANTLRVKEWKKIFHVYSNQKRAGVAVLISDKIDFKSKKFPRDEGHYILIKSLILQEDITIIKTYPPNDRPNGIYYSNVRMV